MKSPNLSSPVARFRNTQLATRGIQPSGDSSNDSSSEPYVPGRRCRICCGSCYPLTDESEREVCIIGCRAAFGCRC